MTYATEKVKAGRQPLTIVELILDSCSATYGSTPCTATGSSGEECYNTFYTCQDTDNFTTTTKTYRFSDRVMPGINAMPCINRVTTAPTKITPGKGLGYRASVTIELSDFPHHDRGIDDYVANRSYDTSVGTFFGKLYARNQYYQGRTLKIKTGYVASTFDETNDFITKEYVIEKIERNSANGKVKIIGKDPLKLVDNERSQCPEASSGALRVAITTSDTSLILTEGEGSGYGSSGFVRINDEIIEFGSRSTDTLTSLTRGQYGTTADAHSIDDTVQLCKEFDGVNVTDIVIDLLTNYAGVSSGYIDTDDWDDEEDVWLSFVNLTTIISEPTGVADLLVELTEENLFDLWWDEKAQTIRLKSIFPASINDTETSYDDTSHLIRSSVNVLENSKDRISQAWIYYAPRDYSQSFSEPDNFARLKIQADAIGESADAYNEKRVQKIYSRWFDSNATGIVGHAASRTLRERKKNQIEFKFNMDAKDSTLWTGDHFLINTKFNQDATGAGYAQRARVLSVAETNNGSIFSYHAQAVSFSGRYALVAPSGAPDYGSATAQQKLDMAFIADDADGFTTDSTEAYKVI